MYSFVGQCSQREKFTNYDSVLFEFVVSKKKTIFSNLPDQKPLNGIESYDECKWKKPQPTTNEYK